MNKKKIQNMNTKKKLIKYRFSFILTLVVPYDHIDVGSALLQMWSYVGAPKCRAIVAIGATAGLSVAMFGSMFPMPRVIIIITNS